ncbi:MAG: asparagine synthase (glutamine-hydrolyzing) [Vicingus serpentipes]|nr:asparagine synthase (glutamine-hydrolyzing) [Vicingus serpentipes]
MCGIAGIISKKQHAVEVLQDISKTLKHRGPDDEGYLLLQEGNFCSLKGDDTIQDLPFQHIKDAPSFSMGLVHRRLSIIDLNKEGHQPMLDVSENYAIVFNGEVYNYKELRKELEADGIIFKSDSDTEVVLQAFIQWGEKCVERFIGMWAFVIYDKSKNQLFASRDRYGIKPFYYYEKEGLFAFASEIKALLKVPEIVPIADEKLVAEYVIFGATSQPYQTLFKGIKELHPGTNAWYNIDSKKLELKSYYQLEDQVKKIIVPSNFEDALTEYSRLFSGAVNLHLRADVPVGTCLSGGLDSSALVAEIAPTMQTELNTFTAAYKDPSIDESPFAKEVIHHFENVKGHFTYPTAVEFKKDISTIVYHHDQPFGSASMYAHWEVMKLAGKQKMKVLLNGQGADESLGGYSNFAGVYLLDLLKQARFFKFWKEKKRIQTRFTTSVNSSIASAVYYHLPASVQSLLRKKERIGHQFLNKEIINQLKIDVPERGGKNIKENSFSAFQFGLADLLRNEDRNSMAFSIESRVPFLDHRLVEYAIALPDYHKINEGWSKYILRKMIETKIPDKVVWRKYKKGFLTPQRVWKKELNNELIKEIKEMNFPQLLDKKSFIAFCEKDLKSNAHLSEFWRMYSLLKWIEIYNVQFE